MKKSIRLWLGVAGVILLCYQVQAAVVQSGTCGGECTWTLDDKGVFKTKNGSTATGEFEIPAGTKTIASSAFNSASGLTKITIPEGVTSIGGYAFAWVRVSSLSIPNSVTSIGNAAFWQMTSVTSFTIPASVTSIGEMAFRDMYSLSEIFLSADSQLTDEQLATANINPDKITYYTSDGKYLKDGKTYASMEDYKKGSYAVYDATGRTYQKFNADGELIGKFNRDGSVFSPKRIYSVSEANEALGKNNRNMFILKYR